MIRISQLRAEVIRPACRLVGWHSPAAEDLLVGTFRAESLIGGDTCLRQLDGGPALAIFQMEPATHDDIWRSWLGYRPEGERVRALTPAGHGFPRAENLVFNLLYAAAMARAHYRRVPTALPRPRRRDGYAAYWKRDTKRPSAPVTRPSSRSASAGSPPEPWKFTCRSLPPDPRSGGSPRRSPARLPAASPHPA